MRTKELAAHLVGLTILTFSALNCATEKADLVFTNGVIHTVDDGNPTAQAVAILENKILAVGSNSEIESRVGQGTRVIDLAGKTVVPGFVDSHYHFMGVGSREFNLNLDGTTSLKEFLNEVEAVVKTKKPGEWITGRGWIEEDWPSKRFPTRYDLDRVAPNNPVILRRADGHAAVVNSKALEIAGVTKETQNPQGGEFLRNKRNGEANGMLIDRAMRVVSQHAPSEESAEVLRQYAKKADQAGLAYGVTQIHDMGSDWQTVELWKDMHEKGELKTRIYAYIRGPGEDADRLLEQGPEIGLLDHRLTVRGIKISQDGALGSRGAALLQPYTDAETSGLLIYKDEEIYPTIKRATESGIQMAVHAIGDEANRNVLDLFERAFNEVGGEYSGERARFRIEHAQIVALEDMPRFADLGIIPSMQPSHAIGDLHFAVRRLGADRMTEGYAWRTFLDLGCRIPGGSDAPVEEGNPMIEFYAAATRTDTTGFSAEGWHPELKMTRAEALKSLTIWGAYAAFEEDLRGSITPGKLADIAVLDRDLMTEPEDRLFDIEVEMTVIGGEIVYEKAEMLTRKR